LAEEYARIGKKIALILKRVRRNIQGRGLDKFPTGAWNGAQEGS
jgi:hypothetical protein